MTIDKAPSPTWMAPVLDALQKRKSPGVLLVKFDFYRPDLVKALAHALGFRFIDFRAEHMMPLGAQAGCLPLSRIGEVIAAVQTERPSPEGIVLHNAEALLATRPSGERVVWLSSMVLANAGLPVVVPLAVFAHEMPDTSPGVVHIDTSRVPPEKLLLRLAAQ
jgi:hypothetical protein